MRIGIGLPAAVPGTDMTTLGPWAAESELAGNFHVGNMRSFRSGVHA
jgi:hypothetical protein